MCCKFSPELYLLQSMCSGCGYVCVIFSMIIYRIIRLYHIDCDLVSALSVILYDNCLIDDDTENKYISIISTYFKQYKKNNSAIKNNNLTSIKYNI